MRSLERLVAFAVILSTAACGGQDESRLRDGRIDLGQDVTVSTKPRDAVFKDFEKNWRKFVTTSPALELPVLVREPEPKEEPWEPLVRAECVDSPDAGGPVPQVTLTWLEPASGPGPIEAAPASPGPGATGTVAASTVRQSGDRGVDRPEPSESSEQRELRFDLALHHQGFARDYYSSALSTARLERFNLPANSALVADTEAVLLTGPGLFPKLMDYRQEILTEAGTERQFDRRTLVLRDFNEGLAYSIRVCVRDAEGWHEEKRYEFLTPVCPHSF